MSRVRSQRLKKSWPELARCVAALLPVERFPAAVRREFSDPGANGKTKSDANDRVAANAGRIARSEPWAIAFSGGADSLALLLALWAHFPERRATCVVLHFDHRLRGAESAADARFCRAVCRSLKLRFVGGAARPGEIAVGSEAAARAARLGFFESTMREHGIRRLVLGQHRDDVTETMLLRLARGSGLSGLAAPRARQLRSDGTTRLRPLLDFSKAELLATLRAAGAPWREDRSNPTPTYFRNRVRSSVVPAWARAVPVDVDLGAAVARSRAQLEEDDDALESWAAQVLSEAHAASTVLSVAGWASLPRAIIRRSVHRWWLTQAPGMELERSLADQLVNALVESRSVRLSAGAVGFLVIDGGWLSRAPVELFPSEGGFAAELPVPLSLPGSCRTAWGAELTAELLPVGRRSDWARLVRSADIGSRVFLGSPMKQPEPLLVRSWQPGDRYQAFGSSHVSKLQDQFINRRIPRGERHRLPVICRADGIILWVPGIPPAEGTRVTPASRSLVQLTYHPPHPRSHPQDV